MRRFLTLVLALSMLWTGSALAQPSTITTQSTGNSVQIAEVNGWVVWADVRDGISCVIGKKDGEERILANNELSELIPAGDGFIRYGADSRGKLKWALIKPETKENITLPMDDTPIGSDGNSLFYYTYGEGSQRIIWSMDLGSLKKKRMGSLNGTVIGMTEDDSVLLCFYARSHLRLWKDGKYTDLYKPDTQILGAMQCGNQVWLNDGNHFNRIENGEVAFSLPGYVFSSASSGQQIAVLIEDKIDAETCELVLIDSVKHEYAKLGDVPVGQAENFPNITTRVLMQPDGISVLTGNDRFEFEIPEDGWVAYT